MDVLFANLEKLPESYPQTKVNIWWSYEIISKHTGEMIYEEVIHWKPFLNVLRKKSTNIFIIFLHL